MKNVLVAIVALFVAYGASAQTAVPDFKNQPMLLKDGKLIKLEKQAPEVKQKVHGMGYGGTTSDLNLDGPKSPVRSTTKPEFMIKVDAETDPETVFYLTKTLPGKKYRSVEMQKQSAFAGYGAQGKSVKRFHVKLSYDKVSDGIYKIKCDESLEDGEEYAFVAVAQGVNTGNTTVFAFGVGGAGK